MDRLTWLPRNSPEQLPNSSQTTSNVVIAPRLGHLLGSGRDCPAVCPICHMALSCLYRKLDSAIMVMKSAEDGRRCDAASVVDGAMDRSVLVEGSMSPQLVIIGGILRQYPA